MLNYQRFVWISESTMKRPDFSIAENVYLLSIVFAEIVSEMNLSKYLVWELVNSNAIWTKRWW